MKRTASFLIPCTVFILSLFLLSCDDDSSSKKMKAYVPDDAALYVSKAGNDSNSGTYLEPKLTIAGALAAIDASKNKILVSAGTYDESVTLADGISLYGGYSASDWGNRNIQDRDNATYQTVIQGVVGNSNGINVSGTSAEEWVIEGFTIQTNHPDSSYGINVTASATVTIRYNTIDGGIGDYESNGIYVHTDNAKTIIDHNIINGGSSTGAASNGIYIETSADQVITDNTINGGSGYNSSAGINMTFPLAGTSLMARNTINGGSNPSQTYAIAIYNYYAGTSAPIIHSNDIDAGDGENCRGIFCYGSADGNTVAPIICNNIIKAVGTYARALYFQNVDGSPVVYNNTISASSANDQANIISSIGSVNQASTPDIQNNIIIGDSTLCVAFYEENNSNSLFSYIMNNDIYDCTCTIITAATAYFELTDLNGLRPGTTSGNISADPALDASYNLTGSSPSTVTEGGLDLSGIADFPENTGGQKIDYSGTARTVPWSIGAYERN